MKKFFAVLFLVVVVGVVGWVLFTHSSQIFQSGNHDAKQSLSGRFVPSGQREYFNPQYHFSLLYPESLGVKETDEGAGAITISFENITESKGFQIFILPYTQDQVTLERFKQDVPSGVRNNPTEVTFMGAKGATFYSVDAEIGDTKEVWFIKNGYLYEVTTLKVLETWLDEVLNTWQFM